MYKIIGERNKVNYGAIDEPVDFNYKDFTLFNLFGREITGLRRKFALHAFNYVGLVTDDHLIGLAAVNLSYAANVFAFVFSHDQGKRYEFNTIMPPWRLCFPINPDDYEIAFKSRKGHLTISKSHARGALDIDGNFENNLIVKGSFPYSLKSHSPLRVLNPSCGDPDRFTFTEKCAPIAPRTLAVSFNGQDLTPAPDKALLLYDWSGGFLNRNTNWLWAAFAGVTADGATVGANFAALVNETYFPENAFWINNQRTRVDRVIFDFDRTNPTGTWRLWSEDGKVDLTVLPVPARGEKKNAGFFKINFQQFVGRFSGALTPEDGRAVQLKAVKGLTEIHYSVW